MTATSSTAQSLVKRTAMFACALSSVAMLALYMLVLSEFLVGLNSFCDPWRVEPRLTGEWASTFRDLTIIILPIQLVLTYLLADLGVRLQGGDRSAIVRLLVQVCRAERTASVILFIMFVVYPGLVLFGQ